MPILNRDEPPGNPDKLVVLIDSSVIIAEQPGLYRDGPSVQTGELSDLEEFIFAYTPFQDDFRRPVASQRTLSKLPCFHRKIAGWTQWTQICGKNSAVD